MDATRARFGTFLVRAREGDICIYADEDILSAFFSLLFCERRRTLREILRAAAEEETRRWNGFTRAWFVLGCILCARRRVEKRDDRWRSFKRFGVSTFLFLCLPLFWPMGSSRSRSCFLDSYVLTDSFLSLIEQTDTATRPDRTRSASSDFRAAS